MSTTEAKCKELGNTPRIWLRVPGYVVRNYSPDLEESVVQHMINIFLSEEPIFSACGLKDDLISMQEIDPFCRGILKQNISLIALPENSPGADLEPVTGVISLAGVNMLILGHKDKAHPPLEEMFKGSAIRKALGTFRSISKQTINFYEHFGVDEMIEAAGLGVDPGHRGCGVGAALLQARLSLCEALGIKATKTIFTSVFAQKIALRCGFKNFLSVKYGDIKNERGEREFPNLPPDYCLMVTARSIP